VPADVSGKLSPSQGVARDSTQFGSPALTALPAIWSLVSQLVFDERFEIGMEAEYELSWAIRREQALHSALEVLTTRRVLKAIEASVGKNQFETRR
jgi:hypothetical protein